MSPFMQKWWAAFVAACEAKGFTPVITQGAYMAAAGGGAVASAGYHDQGGCLDLRVWDRTTEQRQFMVRQARRMGAGAWIRDAKHGGMDPHLHLVLGSDSPLSRGASVQWQQYLAGRDGLASNGPDYHWRPSPLVTTWKPEVPMKELRVATYNVGHKRNKQRVKGEVIRLSRSCDVILLQEAQDYTKELRSIPGFRLKGRGENPILVRDGLKVSKTRRKQVTSKVWKTARGKQTKPEFATFTTVEGVRFSSWHFPPSVQSRLQRLRTPRRFAAYREMAGNFKLGRYRAVAGGDFNVHAPTDNGRVKAFPQAFIARRNAKAVFPDRPTHGKRIIDGFAARGVEVSDVTVLNGYGSDHRPVRMVITYRDR